MNITELKKQLENHAGLNVAIELPDGGSVPAHYHITEVGHVAKKFVDCGGRFRASEACVLQTHTGSPRDDGHRLTAGKFAKILDLARPILPSESLPVEVEHEAGIISQFPLESIKVEGTKLVLQLGHKHTDCLAKEKCGEDEACGVTAENTAEASGCCAGLPGGAACC